MDGEEGVTNNVAHMEEVDKEEVDKEQAHMEEVDKEEVEEVDKEHMEEVDKEEVKEVLDKSFSLMEWRQLFPKDLYVVAEECMKT